MSIALRKPMTLADFLAWEERQELRYEFEGFQPVAMTGGTVEHDQITFNVRKSLDARLAGKPCRPFGPNVKILVDGRARNPDAFVACKPVPRGATVVDEPVTVFEVVSDGNSDTDFIEKNREYRATKSIQRYVILRLDRAAAIVFVRCGNDWLTEFEAGLGAALQLPEIGIDVPLAEVYDGVALADEPCEPTDA